MLLDEKSLKNNMLSFVFNGVMYETKKIFPLKLIF